MIWNQLFNSHFPFLNVYNGKYLVLFAMFRQNKMSLIELYKHTQLRIFWFFNTGERQSCFPFSNFLHTCLVKTFLAYLNRRFLWAFLIMHLLSVVSPFVRLSVRLTVRLSEEKLFFYIFIWWTLNPSWRPSVSLGITVLTI